MTYEEHSAAVRSFSARVYAINEQIRWLEPGADRTPLFAERAAIAREAKAAGYKQIFDGSFRLTSAHVALRDEK